MKSLLLSVLSILTIGQYSSANQVDLSTKVSCLVRSPIIGSSGGMVELTPSDDIGTQFQVDSMSFKGSVVSYTHLNRRFVVMNKEKVLMGAQFHADSSSNQTAKFLVYDQGEFFAEIDCNIN